MEHFGRKITTLTKGFAGVFSNQMGTVSIPRHYYPLAILVNEGKPINQKQLSELLEKDKVTIVRIVDFLEEHGLLLRQNNPNDRREQYLVLTEEGRAIGQKAIMALRNAEDITFANFTKEEKNEFLSYLERIQSNYNAVQHDRYDLNFKKLKVR